MLWEDHGSIEHQNKEEKEEILASKLKFSSSVIHLHLFLHNEKKSRKRLQRSLMSHA